MEKINNILDKIMTNNKIMLLFFIIVGIVLSNYWRYEVTSDFFNYHYFIPWAFFHDRTFVDVAVAMENSYHNPLIEFPEYFLIKYFNDHIPVIYSFNGILFGFLVFAFYKLIQLVFDTHEILQKTQIILTMILIYGGFGLISQVGTSSNEISVTIGVLVSLYLLYKEIFIYQKERLAVFFIAGVILGAMLGLKLTIVIYCVSSGATLIIFYPMFKHPIKVVLWFALGGFCGFCLTHGYWSYILYQNMGNPFFPYLNNIFKSPYYADKFLSYSSFYQKNSFWDYFVFPYLASFQKDVIITSEVYMIDARLAIGQTLFFIVLMVLLIKRNLKSAIQQNKNIIFLVLFTIISYLVWLQLFSIIRYAIPIEMLISLFIVKWVSSLRAKSLIATSLLGTLYIMLAYALFYGFPYFSWGDRKLDDKMMEFEKVVLPKDTLIMAISPGVGLAASHLIESNPTAIVANETSSFTIPGEFFYKKIEELKEKSPYIVYILSLKTMVREIDKYTPIDFVENDNIKEVFSNLHYIIKTELKRENFYCRAINLDHSFLKTFICIDKKDKEFIFPEIRKKKLYWNKNLSK